MPWVNFRIILHLFRNVLNFQNLNLHTQHGVDPVHRYCMGVAGLGYSIDTGSTKYIANLYGKPYITGKELPHKQGKRQEGCE